VVTAVWESPALASTGLDPDVLADMVAHQLDLPAAAIADLVRLNLEALDSALALGVPALLADQLRWQQVRLESAGAPFPAAEVDRAVRRALAPSLGEEDLRQVEELQRLAVPGAEDRPGDTVSQLAEGRARDYLEAALAGERDAAIRVVREAMMADVDASEIMLDILQPAQIELGRLWERGEISIAHEHYTTAVTQLALSLLYPRLLLNRTLLGRSLVATSVGSETHEVGIRMISDLLEHAGWRTAYLGADVPQQEVLAQVAQQRADVLAVSATMAGHVRSVRSLVAAVRADPRCARTRVLVGGRAFTIDPRLPALVGADGWAPDARQALELCRVWAEA
jgi:methanogenic corrinoid protein MtbC1